MPESSSPEVPQVTSYIEHFQMLGYREIDGAEPRNGVTPSLMWKKRAGKDLLVLAVDDTRQGESYAVKLDTTKRAIGSIAREAVKHPSLLAHEAREEGRLLGNFTAPEIKVAA